MSLETASSEILKQTPGSLVILTGPTAAGKTEVHSQLLHAHPEMKKLVTATSRSPRPGEINGKDYHFLTRDTFLERIRSGDFVEIKQYGENLITVMEMSGAAEFPQSVINKDNQLKTTVGFIEDIISIRK